MEPLKRDIRLMHGQHAQLAPLTSVFSPYLSQIFDINTPLIPSTKSQQYPQASPSPFQLLQLQIPS